MTNSDQIPGGALLTRARRVVVKIGSALLLDDSGAPAEAWLAGFAADVAAWREGGTEIVIVSSGAVALGRAKLGLPHRERLEEKQAAAAAGQADLIRAYERAFAPHRVRLAQILLTREDSDNRRRYLNARATMTTLLGLGVIPIVNENDTVATAEIRYGDNDRLAAHAAQMIGADLLVLLSDVDGLYSADPRRRRDARHIPFVPEITPEIDALADDRERPAGLGSGGMRTKLDAAKIAARSGCATIIARGAAIRPLTALRDGARATVFASATTPARARKLWIGGGLKPSGAIVADDGALLALQKGKSLLAAGVCGVEGAFGRGEAVDILARNGAKIARGLAAYDADEIRAVQGAKSDEIAIRLGYRRGDEVIHRDDLVMLGAFADHSGSEDHEDSDDAA
ncbi:MAG: glutamate 5-kinase [Parvularculaceae bacterium]